MNKTKSQSIKQKRRPLGTVISNIADMYSVDEIIAFLKEISVEDKIYPDTNICDDIGLWGDDWHEMIEKYSEKFKVDMKKYLWYFHTKEEGFGSIGGSFFKPPNERVTKIPVIPLMLTEFANKGKWTIDYPDHKLPNRRYDLLINAILIIIALIALAWTGISNLFF